MNNLKSTTNLMELDKYDLLAINGGIGPLDIFNILSGIDTATGWAESELRGIRDGWNNG